ncbi:MAG: hypothetical protein ACI80V_002168 [Rhodothermales bacterium]|jgi:hypothetical protein
MRFMKRLLPLALFATLIWAGCDSASPLEAESASQSGSISAAPSIGGDITVESLLSLDGVFLFEDDAAKGKKQFACTIATRTRSGRIKAAVKPMKLPSEFQDLPGQRSVRYVLRDKDGVAIRLAECIIPDDDGVQTWLVEEALRLPRHLRYLQPNDGANKTAADELDCTWDQDYGGYICEDQITITPDGDILGDPDAPGGGGWPAYEEPGGGGGGTGGPPDPNTIGYAMQPDCSINYSNYVDPSGAPAFPDHMAWCAGTQTNSSQAAAMQNAIAALQNHSIDICRTGGTVAAAIVSTGGFRVAPPGYPDGGAAPTSADRFGSAADWFLLDNSYFAWATTRPPGGYSSLQGAIMHEMDHILGQNAGTDANGHLLGVTPHHTPHSQMCDFP